MHEQEITFQRTRNWKQSADPEFDAKLDRTEHVVRRFPDRCFAFDQFGPLSSRPHHGAKAVTTAFTALKAIRAARPGGAPIHVILDNL
ncbi:hypothetical protein [Qaidamihabitans albus]|uniref:hypothetical protein n=1 Tax=Qaidamihabitans albus TaxID=2795733 RepID=UPI0018F23176|nr:hypothetical protein [Qaidamihabitans albus]